MLVALESSMQPHVQRVTQRRMHWKDPYTKSACNRETLRFLHIATIKRMKAVNMCNKR